VRGRARRIRAGGEPVPRVVVTPRLLRRMRIALVVGAAVAAGSFVAGGLEWRKVRGALVAAEAEHRALGARHEALRERLAQVKGRSQRVTIGEPATAGPSGEATDSIPLLASPGATEVHPLATADTSSAGIVAQHPRKF
jgi:hypothetical protein